MTYSHIKYNRDIGIFLFFIPSQNICLGDCCWVSPSSSSNGNQVAEKIAYWPINNVPSVGECAQKCSKIQYCNGFHYYGKTDTAYGHCYLKAAVTTISTNLGDDREKYGGICSHKGIVIGRV